MPAVYLFLPFVLRSQWHENKVQPINPSSLKKPILSVGRSFNLSSITAFDKAFDQDFFYKSYNDRSNLFLQH